jgi:hypothetical protein
VPLRARERGPSVAPPRPAARPQAVKIGEGTYGEVFRGPPAPAAAADADLAGLPGGLVVKIIPLEGAAPVNGAPQKGAGDLMAEAAIALALSGLRAEEGPAGERARAGPRAVGAAPPPPPPPARAPVQPFVSGTGPLPAPHALDTGLLAMLAPPLTPTCRAPPHRQGSGFTASRLRLCARAAPACVAGRTQRPSSRPGGRGTRRTTRVRRAAARQSVG